METFMDLETGKHGIYIPVVTLWVADSLSLFYVVNEPKHMEDV